MIKMVEPQRMPLSSAPIWPLSVAAYRALGEAGLIPKNTELLYGFVYRKMSKSPLHAALVRQLLKLLAQIPLADSFVSSEQPITCSEFSEPEPDVAVVHGSADDFWHSHPRTAELVIEVCVTSHEYDRSKLPAYAAAGVKEVWLLLSPEKQIEVYRQPVDNKFTDHLTHGPGGTLTSFSVPEFTVDLDALFTR